MWAKIRLLSYIEKFRNKHDFCMQSNLCNTDTEGTEQCARIREVPEEEVTL